MQEAVSLLFPEETLGKGCNEANLDDQADDGFDSRKQDERVM